MGVHRLSPFINGQTSVRFVARGRHLAKHPRNDGDAECTEGRNADRYRREQRGGRAVIVPVALDELFTPIPYIIRAQMFAASLAEERGLNPDQPRALNKVTRTL
jgi:hypothetical protein